MQVSLIISCYEQFPVIKLGHGASPVSPYRLLSACLALLGICEEFFIGNMNFWAYLTFSWEKKYILMQVYQVACCKFGSWISDFFLLFSQES